MKTKIYTKTKTSLEIIYLLMTQCVLTFAFDYHRQQKVMNQVEAICCRSGDVHNIQKISRKIKIKVRIIRCGKSENKFILRHTKNTVIRYLSFVYASETPK